MYIKIFYYELKKKEILVLHFCLWYSIMNITLMGRVRIDTVTREK